MDRELMRQMNRSNPFYVKPETPPPKPQALSDVDRLTRLADIRAESPVRESPVPESPVRESPVRQSEGADTGANTGYSPYMGAYAGEPYGGMVGNPQIGNDAGRNSINYSRLSNSIFFEDRTDNDSYDTESYENGGSDFGVNGSASPFTPANLQNVVEDDQRRETIMTPSATSDKINPIRRSEAGVTKPGSRAGSAGSSSRSRSRITADNVDPKFAHLANLNSVNKPPRLNHDSTKISDAVLAKRGLTRPTGQNTKMTKKTIGANDPENIAIVNMVENDHMKWQQIADKLNEDRVARGLKPEFSANGVHNRYNRTAPVLFAAEGKEWMSIKDRKSRLQANIWTPENELLLVEIEKKVATEKWDRVAQLFNEATQNKHNVTPMQVAIKYSKIL